MITTRPGKMRGPWKVETKTLAYENPWIRIDHHDVIDPSGKQGIYGTIHYKHIAVGVIPLTEDSMTWLVGQYRFPHDAYSWEIPEGGAPYGEDTLLAAQRELKEETGLIAQNWKEILTIHLSNSTSDEIAIIYLARQLTQGTSSPESTEDLRVKKVPFSEAYNMVISGQITDAMSVAAILKAYPQYK